MVEYSKPPKGIYMDELKVAALVLELIVLFIHVGLLIGGA